MQYEKYGNLITSSDFLEYQFTSVGPKGNIVKLIQFTYTEQANIYNLAFGNKLENGSIDDTARDDNKDRNKILATVAATVYEFLNKFPRHVDFFYG